MLGPDRIKTFYDPGTGQMCFEQLARRRLALIQLGKMAVAIGIIIIRIDHDLALKSARRNFLVFEKRYRDEHDIAEIYRLFAAHRLGIVTQIRDKIAYR